MKILGITVLALIVISVVAAHPWLLLVMLLPMLWLAKRKVHIPAKAAGCAFAGHAMSSKGHVKNGNYTSSFIARHEAGHVAAANAIGRRVTNVQVGKGWGWVGIASWHKDPIKNMAFLYGGQIAVGSTSGCSFDNAKIQYWLSKVPPEDRAAATRKAKSIARSATGMLSSVSSNAKTIQRTGTL